MSVRVNPRISIGALREQGEEELEKNATAWIDPRDLLALVEAVEAAERFFFGRAAEDELALAAALRRFDFGDAE